MIGLSGQRSAHTRAQKGQSMVEIAVSLPFLILIVVGLVEMGILFASYLSLVNATFSGAVYASMNPQLVDPQCGTDGNPICIGQNDDDPAYPSASQGITTTTITTTIWDEYSNRVANDIFFVTGEPMRAAQLLNQDILTVDRPITATSTASCSSGFTVQTTLDAGCPITVTTHYRVQTFTSGVSLPYFGRFGLPDYYQIDYSLSMLIR